MSTDGRVGPPGRDSLTFGIAAALAVVVGIVLLIVQWGAFLAVFGVLLAVLGFVAGLVVLLLHRMPRS